ncbi:MAG: zinc dependent phospholipase C family protein [Clostridia bacterium]|nr:zinc dependent phospholipase C family protein [Clostridia bacterium]MDE6614376.1 zinc dependent phospholipase C family protein [Clostridia bacterium]
MPSLYAHYYFANKCVDKFPAELQKIIADNRKFYDLGSHGGDLLFYFKPYKKNDIRSYGSQLHRENFIEQISRFKESASGSCHSQRDIAYLAGYYTHFILDSVVHPYVCKVDAEKVEKHLVIEVDYDRKLLIKTGENPYSNKYLRFQVNDSETQETVAKYMNTSPANIKKTLKARKTFTKMISSQNRLWRAILDFLFKASGNVAGFDILVRKVENDKCKAVRERIDEYMKVALADAEKYANEFYGFLTSSTALGERFDCDFYRNYYKSKESDEM